MDPRRPDGSDAAWLSQELHCQARQAQGTDLKTSALYYISYIIIMITAMRLYNVMVNGELGRHVLQTVM